MERRTGGELVPLDQDDVVPPEPVTDLTVIAVEVDRVRFAFTAPGDDAAAGRAVYAEILEPRRLRR